MTSVDKLFDMLKCGEINSLHFNENLCHIRRYRGNFIVRECYGFGATMEDAAQSAMTSYLATQDRDVRHLGNDRVAQVLRAMQSKRNRFDV